MPCEDLTCFRHYPLTSCPAHSEYQGLTRIMHSMLLDTLLTQAAAKSYAAMLRSFPFPPSWPRVQGPLHHLKSYSLSEHARWSVVIPVLLRCWLRESHLRRPLVTVFQSNGSPNDLITLIVKVLLLQLRATVC